MTLVVLTPAEFASVLEVAPWVARERSRREIDAPPGRQRRRSSRGAALQPGARGTRGRERTLVP